MAKSQSVSRVPLNIWRKYPHEPYIRALIRGTLVAIAFAVLGAFSVHTIAQVADLSKFYAMRSSWNLGIIPQPHLFTNHCTSAMAPDGDQVAFSALLKVTTQCSEDYYNHIDIDQGWIRNVDMFRAFHAENDTTLCLAFECPSCSSMKVNGKYLARFWSKLLVNMTFPAVTPGSIWNTDHADHIGSIALWPWNKVANPQNGVNPRDKSQTKALPSNIEDEPFIVTNGSHLLSQVTYMEDALSTSVTVPSRSSNDTSGDASISLRAPLWPGWTTTRPFTFVTLPALIGTLGGLWSAFGTGLTIVFGTTITFLLLGKKPISASGLFTLGGKSASRRLDERYLIPGRPIDPELRSQALTAYLADYFVDSGELDLTLGRIAKGSSYRCVARRGRAFRSLKPTLAAYTPSPREVLVHLEHDTQQKDVGMKSMQETIDKLGEQICMLEDKNDSTFVEKKRLEALPNALKEVHIFNYITSPSAKVIYAQKVANLQAQLWEATDLCEDFKGEIHIITPTLNFNASNVFWKGKECALCLLTQRELDLQVVQGALQTIEPAVETWRDAYYCSLLAQLEGSLKTAESDLVVEKVKVSELDQRLSKDRRALLNAENQYRDQLPVTENNTLLLTIYQYIEKVVGVHKTPLSQIQLDFDKRCKEGEARFTEKLVDMRK
ncbi:hypothetical protein BDQ12DRAFT_668562 [Crucibulum laeve]|uniref:Uncharacterized protein n=1 Tax=Crucibulum laeve TaxID=68775 RepID=A0A5C3LQX5_9AGAR|nr:hypothetical protein BDQ12DRAFT_668562 [Crucibulum laeve]